jgi:hypothetical protein
VAGLRSNLFLVIDGVLRTPPVGPGVVAGVTRELVLEWAALTGVPNQVRACTYKDLRAADEALLTSSAFGIVSVATVDGLRVGAGQRGPIACALRRDYLTRLMRLWLGTGEPSAALCRLGLDVTTSRDGSTRVSRVDPGGSAARAGLQEGDAVIRMGTSLACALQNPRGELRRLAQDAEPLVLHVQRNGQRLSVSIVSDVLAP